MPTSSFHSINANYIQSNSFDYSSLDEETKRFVQQKTDNIRVIYTQTLQNAFLIGEILLEVKAKLDYGQFCRWVSCEFQGSQSTAINHMHLATTFRFATVANLNVPLTVLYEIARPTIPDTARAEVLQLAQDNKRITKARAKKIIANHKRSQVASGDSTISDSVPITIDNPYSEIKDLPDNVIGIDFSRNKIHQQHTTKSWHFNALDVLILILGIHISQIQYFLDPEVLQEATTNTR